MNVDNGFRVFKYNGIGPVVHHQQQTEDPLYYAAWHPRDSQLYPNRGQSPKRTDGVAEMSTNTTTSPVAATSTVKAAPAPYRPPGSTGALSDLLRREAAPVGKIKPAGEAAVQKKPVVQPPPARRIPGMAPPPTTTAVQANGKKPAAEKKVSSVPAAVKPSSTQPAVAPTTAPAEQSVDTNPAARLKNLRKRIKQIQEIRAKLAEEPGFKPNVDQLNKLASEPALLAEAAELEAILK